MSKTDWLSLALEAQTYCSRGEYRRAIDIINALEPESLPRMESLEKLPYHVLSGLLCRLPKVEDRWLLEKVKPALLKWLANQGSDTSAGVPYLARHISNLFWGDRAKYEAYRVIVEQAVLLFSFDRHINPSEAMILCQSSLPENRPVIDFYLDSIFSRLNPKQANHIFAFTNDLCIDWFIKNRRRLLQDIVDAEAYFNVVMLTLGYGHENDAEMAISHSAKLQPKDKLLDETFATFRAARQYFPRPHAPKARLNVALCIAGQLRGYKEAFRTWSALGIDNHDVDVFVNVWGDIGRKMPVPDHATRSFPPRFATAFVQYVNEVGTEEFWRRYPSLFAIYGNPEQATREELCDFYRTEHVIVGAEDEHEFASNSDRMYFRNREAMRQVRATGKQFDLIIKMRPDISLRGTTAGLDLSYIHDQSFRNNVIYSDRCNFLLSTGGYSVGDQIAIGTAPAMQEYASIWDLYRGRSLVDRRAFPYGMPADMYPHVNIAHHCLSSGILFRDINHLSPIVGDLLDPVLIKQDLLSSVIERDFPDQPTQLDEDLRRSLSDDL